MPKEVLFIIDSLGGGGAERVVTLLANHLAEEGYKTIIITLLDEPQPYIVSDKVIVINIRKYPIRSLQYKVLSAAFGYYVFFRQRLLSPICKTLRIHLPAIKATSLFYYFRYSLYCREILKKHLGGVVFAFLVPASVTLAMASKGLNIKTVYCERSYPYRTDWSQDRIRLRNKYASKYKYSVFQTETQKEYYASIIKGDKAVIRNPVKDDLPDPFSGKRSRRIVCFCRLQPMKNLPLLIDAFAEVHSKYPDYCLEIYGEGPERNRVIDEIKCNYLEESVIIKPFSTNIHQDVLDAAMFVSTSDFEGLSNSMLEAMAIGLPCICTDCDGGGAREIIKNGENGLLVPKGDKAAVVNAIETLIMNPDYAEMLGKNASKIRDELSEERIIEEWKKML